MAKKLREVAGLDESGALDSYISSKGLVPTALSTSEKSKHFNSKEYSNWKNSRAEAVAEVSELDESGTHSHIATIVDNQGNLVNKFSYEAKNKKKAKKIAKKRVSYFTKTSPENSFKVASVKRIRQEELEEDIYQDSQAATQTVFDGANNPKDVSERSRQLSKTARMIKALYKHHRVVKEDLYDKDAEKTYVPVRSIKEPKQPPEDKNNYGDDEPKARAIMKGGKTMTGQKRDIIEIDPSMKKPDLGKK